MNSVPWHHANSVILNSKVSYLNLCLAVLPIELQKKNDELTVLKQQIERRHLNSPLSKNRLGFFFIISEAFVKEELKRTKCRSHTHLTSPGCVS